MSFPAILQIIKTGTNRYMYTLMPAGPFGAASMQEWHVQIDERAVTSICRMILEAVEQAIKDPRNDSINPTEFLRWGAALYNAVMPAYQVESLRRELSALQAPLLISTNDPAVHWELLTDGILENVFCFKYPVGRRLHTSGTSSKTAPRRGAKWRCLIIADPQGNLPASAAEAEHLSTWLKERKVECDCLVGRNATFDGVLKRLQDEYDIVHYAGHGVSDALRLHDGEFSHTSIRTFVKGNPIVFVNGCLSATAIDGLADAFIKAGARLVVGSMFEAPDEGAREFAKEFYAVLLGGKPVGEAIREARKHVMTNLHRWGPSWVCFVLYGDPSLCIELAAAGAADPPPPPEPVDELEQALGVFGLSRADFAAQACRVVQTAIDYGRQFEAVDTAHLFAAMVGGESAFLRDRLREKRVPAEKLEDGFREAFKEFAENKGGVERAGRPITFSTNTGRILQTAKTMATAGTPALVTEIDLVRAFVAGGGGGTGEILQSLGISVADLSPDAAPGRRATKTATRIQVETPADDEQPPLPRVEEDEPVITRVGELTEGHCSPAGWRVLVTSVRAASDKALTRADLYYGLLATPDSELVRALGRIGYPALLWTRSRPRRHQLAGQVPCSPGVHNILVRAQFGASATMAATTAALETFGVVQAQRSLVAERHLLEAFARESGNVGQWLLEKGVVIEAVVSDLFLDEGRLDLSRFSPAMAGMCQAAGECAERKRDSFIGRRHFVHAALRAGGIMAQAVTSRGHDAELVADQLFTIMHTGRAAAPPPLSTAGLAPTVVAAFCRAEHDVSDTNDVLTESRVLAAIFHDGGGAVGAFLTDRGIKLPDLG